MKRPTKAKKVSGGLFGALAIAGGSSAYGAVVTVTPPATLAPASLPQTTNISRTFDLNSDGTTDFTFQFRQPQSSGFDWQATIVPATGDFTFGQYGLAIGEIYVQRYLAGELIGNTPPTHTGAVPAGPTTNVFASKYGANRDGQVLPPNSRGFVGLKLTAGANTFYGYIELQVTRSTGAGSPGIQFFSAAYDNTSLTPIAAGAVPEPGTLAMLAFGGATVLAAGARRRHSKRRVGK
jgi:PEP-CTERM motif